MSDQLSREEVIFEEALKRASDTERVVFLDDACRGHPEMRARLDVLLEGYFKGTGFLDSQPEAIRACGEGVGTAIGRYKLLEKIGEGGFGVVYVAEQTEPVKRRVALKLIKLGMDTKQVIARFDAERQALAMMDHPSIAKVLDGGATDTGRPYFVMELVRGIPITNYCDEHELPTSDRLELFMQVCEAVQHAHQKGIIHRDLKPSNILVTVNDGRPVPKVIDFGVAKATQQALTEETIFTQFHQFIGTPAYMSPEQAEMTGVDIDTRTDIYALGVLLYELLTGKTPFDGKDLMASGLDEMRRIIREKEPLKPSTRFARERAAASFEIRNPKSEVDADLDWIVMKCLEKDRARRYETANGLASDLQRYLQSEAILARPPSAAYRIRKFVRRHKLQVIASGVALAALVSAAVVSSWQAMRADRERALAESRLRSAALLMQQAFQSVSPALSDLIGTTKARNDLAQAALGIVEELRREPNPSPEMRRMLVEFYLQLSYVQAWMGYGGNTTGEFEEGLKSTQQAMALLNEAASSGVGDDYIARKMARAEMAAGFAMSGLLRFDQALEHVANVQKWAVVLQGSSNASSIAEGHLNAVWARQLTAEALIRSGKSEEALRHLGDSLAEFRRRTSNLQTASRNDLWMLHSELELLGAAHLKLGHKEEAAGYWRERLTIAEVENQRWPHLMQFAGALVESRAQLGEVLIGLDKSEEALPLLAAALQQVDALRKLDPENVGLVLLKVRVLGSHVSGYLAWADTNVESRAQRLKRAEEYLGEAQTRLNRLKPEALRRFGEYELAPIERRLAEAKAAL